MEQHIIYREEKPEGSSKLRKNKIKKGTGLFLLLKASVKRKYKSEK